MGTTVDRGWEQGKVGWGVQGNFGSSGKDECAQVLATGSGSFKMVKNSKGLWVKVSSLEEGEQQRLLQGKGRGAGIPLVPHSSSSSIASHDKSASSIPLRAPKSSSASRPSYLGRERYIAKAYYPAHLICLQ